jgi:hypothetical protein
MCSDRSGGIEIPAKYIPARRWLRIVAAFGLLGVGLLWKTGEQEVPVRTRTAEIDAIVREAGATWRTESSLYAYQNSERVGGFYAADQLPSSDPTGEVRVLVLGDSYTFGTGLEDIDLRWPTLLEALLERNGTEVDVVTLAQGGASTITQARILDQVAAGVWEEISWKNPAQAAAALGKPFDYLIIGFVANDVLPGFYDGHQPDYDLEERVVRDGKANPYEREWLEALERIARWPVRERYILNLDYTEPGYSYARRLAPVFQRVGFKILDTPELENAIAREQGAALMVHPADAHPGPIVLRAYARDAARELGARNGTYNLTVGNGGREVLSGGVVSNYMPVTATWRRDGAGEILDIPASANLIKPCDQTYPCRHDGEPFETDGEPEHPRTHPCARIGASYVYVGLREAADPVLRITLEDGGEASIVPIYLEGGLAGGGMLRDGEAVPVVRGGTVGINVRVDSASLKGVRVVVGKSCETPTDIPAIRLRIETGA